MIGKFESIWFSEEVTTYVKRVKRYRRIRNQYSYQKMFLSMEKVLIVEAKKEVVSLIEKVCDKEFRKSAMNCIVRMAKENPIKRNEIPFDKILRNPSSEILN
jgi:hypothetical protein